MKIQVLLLRLAPGMSVDTKCDKKVWYWNKKFAVIRPLFENVFRIEKKFEINHFFKCSSLNNQREFVIGLFVFYTVPTCQTLGIYY